MAECDLCYAHHSTFSPWVQSLCWTKSAHTKKTLSHAKKSQKGLHFSIGRDMLTLSKSNLQRFKEATALVAGRAGAGTRIMPIATNKMCRFFR